MTLNATEVKELEVVGEEIIKALTVTTSVPEFMTCAEMATKLRIAYRDVEPDMSTKESREVTTENWRKFRNVRLALDKAKPEAKGELQKKLNDMEADYKQIHSVLSEFENKFKAAITKYDDDKKAEKAERDRIAAEAQKALDDKIFGISQLPLRIVGKNSIEIETFLGILEESQFGAEFTGGTLTRAQAAKQGAVDAIRQALADTKEAEEKAAQAERERIDRERISAIQAKISNIIVTSDDATNWPMSGVEANIRTLESYIIDDSFQEFSDEATAAKMLSLQTMQKVLGEKQDEKRIADEAAEQLKKDQAELAEQKRLQDIENERIRKEQEERDQQAAKERAEAQSEIDRQNAELKRQQMEMQAKIDAENAKIEAEKQRLSDEEAARQAEIEAAAIVTEQPPVETPAELQADAADAAMVTIPVSEYNELLHDSQKLAALELAGVDNWEYYDDAMSLMEDGE
jgi:fused signal recognition particle receptor